MGCSGRGNLATDASWILMVGAGLLSFSGCAEPLIFVLLQENFDKRDKKKAQITFPLRHFFPLKVVK
jgi:hypothetical protein